MRQACLDLLLPAQAAEAAAARAVQDPVFAVLPVAAAVVAALSARSRVPRVATAGLIPSARRLLARRLAACRPGGGDSLATVRARGGALESESWGRCCGWKLGECLAPVPRFAPGPPACRRPR